MKTLKQLIPVASIALSFGLIAWATAVLEIPHVVPIPQVLIIILIWMICVFGFQYLIENIPHVLKRKHQ